MTRYKDLVNPIERRPVGVWQANFEDGEKRLYIVSKLMEVEEVVQMIKVHDDRMFDVVQIWVGEFEISEVIVSYSADGRHVTRNMEVTLGETLEEQVKRRFGQFRPVKNPGEE